MALNPLNQRRWQNFKANKRGFFSLWLFIFLCIICLFAEFIANDKPIIINYENAYYFPTFNDYPETMFGGYFETSTDYRDPFIQEQIQENGWQIWPIIPFHYDTIIYDLSVPAPSPPSVNNWLGTDDEGRDVVARLIYGFRISLLFGLTLTIISTVIGIFFGAIQGYYGGKIDLLGQRFIEIWSGLPVLFLLIILSSIIQPNFWWLLGIMLLFSWMSLVDYIRAEFLKARNFEYVLAARALGQRNLVVMFKHIFPNTLVAAITLLPFILVSAIGTLTALDFLGFGLPPGSPSLGELVAQAKTNLQAPWLGLSAFFTLSIMLALLVFIGEAARDSFDAKK